jgi:hypothetical protein
MVYHVLQLGFLKKKKKKLVELLLAVMMVRKAGRGKYAEFVV